MRIKLPLLSIALFTGWLSVANADDMPPGFPFQAVTEENPALSPPQSGVQAGTQEPTQMEINGAINPDVPQVQPNGLIPQPTVSLPETEPAVVKVSEELAPEKPMVKQREKKRPNLLNKPLESTATTEQQKNEHAMEVQSGIVIKPKRGKTENVVIARGKLNRIVTPYSDPKVLTVDAVETKIDGSAVYIATDSETPVSLFISDTESGQTTSLQLTPKALLTPVEILIEGWQSQFLPGGDSDFDHAKVFRKDLPYISELKSILQSLGKQQIPQGFTLEETTEKIRSLNLCHDPNLTFWPGQIISGHESQIIVMVAQNTGATATVFEEASCATENTIAVAAWPKLRLEPKDRTEVYILMRLPAGKSNEEARPSLLN